MRLMTMVVFLILSICVSILGIVMFWRKSKYTELSGLSILFKGCDLIMLILLGGMSTTIWIIQIIFKVFNIT